MLVINKNSKCVSHSVAGMFLSSLELNTSQQHGYEARHLILV